MIPVEFLGPLANHIDTLQAVAIPGEEASLSASESAAASKQLGIITEEAAGFVEALRRIIEQAEKPGRILICGSLYSGRCGARLRRNPAKGRGFLKSLHNLCWD